MPENKEILALHRYFIWANQMRNHFDSLLGSGEERSGNNIEPFLYMSYWYGGLYVVIEGWKKLGLSDPTIDSALHSPNVDLLRRYRNGVFHFQKKYYDDRFMKFMSDGQDCVLWVRDLNREFGRFFLEWLKSSGLIDKGS